MTMIARIALVGVLTSTLVACDGFARAVTSHTNVLARAAGHELAVEQAASLIAPHTGIPAQPQVVEAVANLWVDYTLLATAATQDSLLRNVDVDLYLRPMLDQQAVLRLRDEVVQVDTVIGDDELQAQYEEEGPVQVSARHILLRLPDDPTQEQRDSVRAQMAELRDRALADEDFAELAREFSQDGGTAQQGGHLGTFTRGQMLAPIEEAALATPIGEVSDVVESIHGYHIIQVDQRELPDFEAVKDSFRGQVISRRQEEAIESYVENLTGPRELEVQDGAVENAKALALKPNMNLSGRAASRALVRYDGGGLNAEDFLDQARTWDPGQRGQLAAATDDAVDQILEGLTRDKILVQEAENRGLEATPVQRDSMRAAIQGQLAMFARSAGFTSIQPQDGETMYQAVDRRVRNYLDAIMRGEQNAIPLGAIGFSLRQHYGGEIFDRSFDAVVTQIAQNRPAAPPPAAPAAPAAPPSDTPAVTPPATPPADTGSSGG